MTDRSTHRLAGLEPDNLLAFLALLGLLRSLEEARPKSLPRVAWTVDEPPVRPALHVAERLTEDEILTVAATGLNELARRHDFGELRDLKLTPCAATQRLRAVAAGDRYTADLWAALISDAAVRDKKKAREAEPTPLCLLFGQGHMHFLSRLASVPREAAPPPRGRRSAKTAISDSDCLREALFQPWARLDATSSFRWDPHEDVRYATRATDPTDAKTKERTQHGANRLAAIGLSALTVVPRAGRHRWSTSVRPRRIPRTRRAVLHMADLASSDQPRRDPGPARSPQARQPGHAGCSRNRGTPPGTPNLSGQVHERHEGRAARRLLMACETESRARSDGAVPAVETPRSASWRMVTVDRITDRRPRHRGRMGPDRSTAERRFGP